MSEGRAQLWHLYLGPDYSGFRVYHFAAGTGSAKDVWADPEKSTTLGNPVLADSNGWIQFFADGVYRLLVTDKNGIIVRDLDPIRITNDQGFVWEGSHGTTLPAADALSQHHLFVKHTAGGAFQGIYYNDGTAYQPVTGSVTGGLLDVRTFGVVGDGVTDDAAGFQLALDAGASTGCTVYVPPGEYLIGAQLFIDSNTTLWMDSRAFIIRNFDAAGTRLIKNKNAPVNPRNGTIAGANSKIRIIGGCFKAASSAMRGGFFDLIDVVDVELRDIRAESWYSDWNIHLIGNDCVLSNLVLDNEAATTDGTNLHDDGIHVFGGDRILIDGCFIRTGDDCIAIANSVILADEGVSTYFNIADVAVSNCVLESLNSRAIDVGLNDTDDDATQTVSGIAISNLVILDNSGLAGVPIMVEDSRGGTSSVYDVVISNVVIQGVGRGINLTNVKRVTLSHIKVTGHAYGKGYLVSGCSNITLLDCSMAGINSNSAGNQAMLIEDSDDVRVIGGRYATPNITQVVTINDSTQITFRDVELYDTLDGYVTVLLDNTTNVLFDGCYFRAAAGATPLGVVTFTGTTDEVSFINNDFTNCSDTFRYGGVIPANVLVANNRGYKTFAQGLATIANGDSYVDVTHGVKQIYAAQAGSVPAQHHRIQVTPVDATNDIYAWAVSNTAIRIQSNGGAVGADKRISWTIDHRHNFET